MNNNEASEIMNKIAELSNEAMEINRKKDFTNPRFKQIFIDILEFCKPLFIACLDDAQGVKVEIERKNQILDNMRANGDYDSYYKAKQELSNINGSGLEHNLSLLETYLRVIQNFFGTLRCSSCFSPEESDTYYKKINRLVSIKDEIEDISYMR